MGGKVGENPAALRAAVFFAILEKPEGGVQTPPPPAGRGLRQSSKWFLDMCVSPGLLNAHIVS